MCPHNLSHTWLPRGEVVHDRVGQRSEVTYRCTVTIDCGLMLPTEKLWFSTCVTAAGNPGKVEWGGSCVYGNSFLVCLLFGRQEYRCALMTLIPPQRKRKFWWFQQKLWTMSSSDPQLHPRWWSLFVSGPDSQEGLNTHIYIKLILNLLPSAKVNIGLWSLRSFHVKNR